MKWDMLLTPDVRPDVDTPYQNFHLGKLFFGGDFRHQTKILSSFPDEFFPANSSTKEKFVKIEIYILHFTGKIICLGKLIIGTILSPSHNFINLSQMRYINNRNLSLKLLEFGYFDWREWLREIFEENF